MFAERTPCKWSYLGFLRRFGAVGGLIRGEDDTEGMRLRTDCEYQWFGLSVQRGEHGDREERF